MVQYKLGELFSGPGGLSYGAMKAKIEINGELHEIVHEWASDYDEHSCKTYSQNICGTAPGLISESVHHKDVAELDIKTLGNINILAFGFPCNDFSLVGESKGMDGNYGMLYQYGVAALNFHQPEAFVAENVSGISSSNDGLAFAQILSELRNAGEHGYEITSELYSFEHFGVPQNRHRYIIVGIRRDLKKKYIMPANTHTKPVTSFQALEEPPHHLIDFGIIGAIPEGFPDHRIRAPDEVVKQRLIAIPEGENAWCAEVENDPLLRINTKTKLSSIYRRLDRNRPAYTVTGSGGGGTHMYHWEEPRALSNREKARLQTFPDTYQFSGGVTSVRKQIGMAVPPYGAKLVFEALLATLADAPTLQLMSEVDPKSSKNWLYRVRPTQQLLHSDSELKALKGGSIMIILPSISVSEIESVAEQIGTWLSGENKVQLMVTNAWKNGMHTDVIQKLFQLQIDNPNFEFRSSYILGNDAILVVLNENGSPETMYAAFTGDESPITMDGLRKIQILDTLSDHVSSLFSESLPNLNSIQTTHAIEAKIEEDKVAFSNLASHTHKKINSNWVLVESIDLANLVKGGSMSSFNLDFGKGRSGKPRRWTELELVINQRYPNIPKEEFTAHTFDGISLQMHRSGQNHKNLSSKYSKKEGGLRMFGYWIKNHLRGAGVWMPNQRVTEATFEAYGKTTLDFYKIKKNEYFIDFRPNHTDSA